MKVYHELLDEIQRDVKRLREASGGVPCPAKTVFPAAETPQRWR